jgi:hypothetical protein
MQLDGENPPGAWQQKVLTAEYRRLLCNTGKLSKFEAFNHKVEEIPTPSTLR